MRQTKTVEAFEELVRARLSKSFFLREFLFSDIAAINGPANVPDDPEVAIAGRARLSEGMRPRVEGYR